MTSIQTTRKIPSRIRSRNRAVLLATGRVALITPLLIGLLGSSRLCAEEIGKKDRVIAQGCPADVDLEKGDAAQGAYTIRNLKIANPFDFVPWIHARDEAAGKQIAELLDHQPFTYHAAVSRALGIIEDQGFIPEISSIRVKLLVETVFVSCSGSQVDIVYHVLSSAVAPSLAIRPEEQVEMRQTPQAAAGIEGTPSKQNRSLVTLDPALGFDATDRFYSGGRFGYDLCPRCRTALQLTADGQGSQSMAAFKGRFVATHDSRGPIRRSTYSLNYRFHSLPTGAGQIRRDLASVEYSGESAPFLKGNVSARFGGLIAKGNDNESLRRTPFQDIGPAASAVNALKLYGGLDSRLEHNVASASFGLELGTADVTSGVQWKKFLGDVHHDFWHAVGDHNSVDIDSRFTAGAIQSGGKLPIAERFFGGNYQDLFIPDDTWQIRANPVIRAIPGSRYFQTADGAGATSFVAYNMTAALTVWRKPLVPPEVSKDKDGKFSKVLNAQLDTVTSIEQLHYAAQDPHYGAAVSELRPLLTALQGLKEKVNTAKGAHPGQFQALFSSCLSGINIALERVQNASDSTSSRQYGDVAALLSADKTEDRLRKVVERCGENLSAAGEAGIATGVTTVETARQAMEGEFQKIDQRDAAAKANADIKPVRRMIQTLFKEVNLASVSPVAVFDVAKIGPAGPGVSGTRYGPGGGLRIDVASTVHFTVGYARNVSPGPGEGSGAVFFEAGIRDLFR